LKFQCSPRKNVNPLARKAFGFFVVQCPLIKFMFVRFYGK